MTGFETEKVNEQASLGESKINRMARGKIQSLHHHCHHCLSPAASLMTPTACLLLMWTRTVQVATNGHKCCS